MSVPTESRSHLDRSGVARILTVLGGWALEPQAVALGATPMGQPRYGSPP